MTPVHLSDLVGLGVKEHLFAPGLHLAQRIDGHQVVIMSAVRLAPCGAYSLVNRDRTCWARPWNRLREDEQVWAILDLIQPLVG